jgi:hypothetical protein
LGELASGLVAPLIAIDSRMRAGEPPISIADTNTQYGIASGAINVLLFCANSGLSRLKNRSYAGETPKWPILHWNQ